MKTATAYYTARPHIPFPNAATRQEMIRKFVDRLLLVASGFGITATIMLLLVML